MNAFLFPRQNPKFQQILKEYKTQRVKEYCFDLFSAMSIILV